uniref:Uncharacterized protein n=1 Tax=Avena sativa TaxID=4498 RepID=A0ACD5YUX5_AVESA
MALQSCHSDDFCVQLPPPPLPNRDWEWEWEVRCTLGGDDAAAAAARGLEGGIHDAFAALPSCGESPVSSLSSEASSGCSGRGGYLEDAVAHWSDRCKRQRTAAAEKEEEEVPPRCPAMASEDLHSLLQSFWDPASSGEGGDLLLRDLNAMAPGSTGSTSFVSEQGDASGEQTEGAPTPTPSAAAAGQGEGEADEAAAGPPPLPPFSATGQRRALPPLPRLQKATTGRGSNYCDPASSSSSPSPSPEPSLPAAGKRGAGVVYPFAVVKPLGLDDGSTLNDVNRRILKRPARPVRHPVGQFACSPVVSSAHGLGLSGKAVVSLTRIRTGGKGTITIIRTRG